MPERAIFGVQAFFGHFSVPDFFFWDGVKVSVTRWLSRFFLVISVDAPRRALGRDNAIFLSKKRRAPYVESAKLAFSSIFWLVPLKKNDKTV